MSITSTQDESIKSFLERLKLAEKYTEIFVSHGYLTVEDCYGITEETLKGIGITLPGHYRRILSKLPGCKVQKPPRLQRSSIIEHDTPAEPPVESVEPLHPEVFEAEDIYIVESPLPVVEKKKDFREEIGDERLLGGSAQQFLHQGFTNAETLVKPPRSSDRIVGDRVSPSLQVEIANDLNESDPSIAYDDITKALPTCHSPNSISTALNMMLKEPPGVSSSNEDSDVYEEALENNTSISSEISAKNLPLPSPPTAVLHENDDEETFPSPPSHPNMGLCDEDTPTVNESDYDRLSITRSGATNFTSKDTSTKTSSAVDPYDTLATSSPRKQVISRRDIPSEDPGPNLQVAPRRMPAYEEIELATRNEDVYDVPSHHSAITPSTDNSDFGVKALVKASLTSVGNVPMVMKAVDGNHVTSQADKVDNCTVASNVGVSPDRSSPSEIYDVAVNFEAAVDDSEENVYDVCTNDEKKPGISDCSTGLLADQSNSSILQRSSGSLPENSIKPRLNRTQILARRRECDSSAHPFDSNLSDHSSEADTYAAASDVPQLGEQQTKDVFVQPSNKLDSAKAIMTEQKNKRTNTSGNFMLKNRLRIGGNKKTARPFSVIVDSPRVGQNNVHSSSEESLDAFGSDAHKHHKRATSISDNKITSSGSFGSGDLVDAQLLDDQSTGPTNEIQATSNVTTFQKKTKQGWLYKQGGHEGRGPPRKRWVVFDGDELTYYESDTKMELSKGVIPVDVMLRIQVVQSDSKVFHIQTKGGRKYIFQAESSEERSLWSSTLVASKMIHEKQVQGNFKPGGSMYMPYKEGALKMEGVRQKAYLATKGEQLAYYKSQHEFNFGQPITRLSMKIATVKDVDKKRFQVIFPFRTFTFTAENEDEKRSWIEALQDAVAEALSDYKVVNEIWTSPANRKCADCGRDDPDWASINLAIVICKHCAGVHRDLGVHNSKVRSLKMDVKIWNETMKGLLFILGNAVANSFWRAKLKSSDAINEMADKKLRSWHITSKYIEMQYADLHRSTGNQEMLNQTLINAVRNNDMSEAYRLIFSGADPNCGTGKDHAKTPFLLSKHLNYHVMAEFLSQNGGSSEVSPQGHVTDRSNCVKRKESLPKNRAKPTVMLKNNLFKYGGDFKNANEERKQSRSLDFIIRKQGDFQKRVCVLENNVFKYYDPEKPSVAKDEVECSELLSIGVCQPEQATKAGFVHCFEVSRTTGRTYLFCSDRHEIAAAWTRGLLQAIVPPHVQNAMKQDLDYDRIGKMSIKSQHLSKKPSEWKPTWCKLKGKNLHYYHQDSITMECIDLRRLVQIGLDLTQDGSASGGATTKDSGPTFMLVFREKSYYLRADTKADSEAWLSAVRKADSEYGPELTCQQLTAEGVPLILEKCTTYIEQFGLTTRGIYRLNGTHSKTSQLLSDFQQNARDTQMRDADLNIHDVSSALKRWFKSLPGSLLTEDLHEEWIDTSQIDQEHHNSKMRWYKHLIEKLPEINRNTLKVLLAHLKNVASHEKENEMSIHNLAIVFGPTILQPQAEGDKKYVGETSQEIGCLEDLLRFYDWLFDITDVDREKERLMLEAKEKISMATQQQGMLTTLDYDMMVPIYIGNKDEKCVNYKVNMTACDLIARICVTHGYPRKTWGLFEVISDGDAERPLHYSEHVLSVIKSWEMPSTNYLLAKHDYVRDKLRWLKRPTGDAVDALYEGNLKVYDLKKKWVRMNSILKVVDDELTLSYVKSQDSHASVRDVASGNWRKRSTKLHSISRKIGGNFDAKSASHVSLTPYNVYIGVDRRTKPPSTKSYGFTLASRSHPTRYFIADSEVHLYKWYGHTLMSKSFFLVSYQVEKLNNVTAKTLNASLYLKRIYKNRYHLKLQFPEGFTPTSSPVLSPDFETTPRILSDSGMTKRFAFPGISQGDLGEAAKAVALQRAPSSGSNEQTQDVTYDTFVDDAPCDSMTSVTMEQLPNERSSSNSFSAEDRRTSSFSISPVDQNRASGFFGLKLQSELSSVLRKRSEQ